MLIYVSLTSTQARLPLLKHTLISLLDQTRLPDRIIVNLSREPYLLDLGISELPAWFDNFNNTPVEVNWVPNTGPYRKLLPALDLATDDDLVVTCDDDVIYGPQWLEKLLDTAELHPDAIICGRARMPVKNIFGTTQTYLFWPVIDQPLRDPSLTPIGIAGVVYRRRLLAENLIKSQDFLVHAPRQDDLWFNLASRVQGTPVAVAAAADDEVHPIETKNNLALQNVADGGTPGWSSLPAELAGRVVLKIKAYMGIPICENDRVLRKLARYQQIEQRTVSTD